MKKSVLSLVLLLAACVMLSAQNSRKLFVGILPDVTREIKDNEEKVFSVNLMPLAAQVYLNEFSGIRLITILNLESSRKEISNVWAQLGFLFYFLVKRGPSAGGIYVAPVAGFTHNKQTAENEFTLAIEPGYSYVARSACHTNVVIHRPIVRSLRQIPNRFA